MHYLFVQSVFPLIISSMSMSYHFRNQSVCHKAAHIGKGALQRIITALIKRELACSVYFFYLLGTTNGRCQFVEDEMQDVKLREITLGALSS